MKILVVPDTHVPYHNKKNWALCLKTAKTLKPDLTVFIGDFADFYAVSHFPKNPARNMGLQREVAAVNREMDAMGRIIGKRGVFLLGNHEWRLERYLEQRAPELFDMVRVQDLFRLEERGWPGVPYHSHYKVGKVLFTHDLGHSGAHAGFQTLAAAGTCVVFGHTHRGSVVYDGTVAGDHRFALNVGWLGDARKVDYIHRAKTRAWQQGFGWINMKKGLAWAQFAPIVKGQVCVDGHWIS